MKSFLLAMLGGFLGVFAALFLYAQYSDYRATSQTQGWIMGVETTQKQIVANALRANDVSISGRGVAKPTFAGFSRKQQPDHVEVSDNGTIVMQGGIDGQAIVLIPGLERGKVVWRCVGGPTKAMMGACRIANDVH